MPVATQSVVGGAHQARDQPHGDHRSQRAVGPPHRQPCQLRIGICAPPGKQFGERWTRRCRQRPWWIAT